MSKEGDIVKTLSAEELLNLGIKGIESVESLVWDMPYCDLRELIIRSDFFAGMREFKKFIAEEKKVKVFIIENFILSLRLILSRMNDLLIGRKIADIDFVLLKEVFPDQTTGILTYDLIVHTIKLSIYNLSKASKLMKKF